MSQKTDLELDLEFQSATAQLESPGSFMDLIHSPKFQLLRARNFAACARLLINPYKNLPDEHKPGIARYLLNGYFARNLSFHEPEAYANFILNIVGGMADDDGRNFTKSVVINEGKGTELLHFLKTESPLPPIVTIVEYGELVALSVSPLLKTRLPHSSYNKARDLIIEQARQSRTDEWARFLIHTSYRLTPI